MTTNTKIEQHNNNKIQQSVIFVNKEQQKVTETNLAGSKGFPFQSVRPGGGTFVNPSHHTSLSAVRATFVKSVLREIELRALGLESFDVPIIYIKKGKRKKKRGEPRTKRNNK